MPAGPREGLVTEDSPALEVDHGLEARGDLLGHQDLLKAAPALERALHGLDAHAFPRLFHESRDQALRHDEGVEEDDGEAHGDLVASPQVGRSQPSQLPVQVLLHPAARGLKVGDAGLTLTIPTLRRKEQEEGVAPLVADGHEVVRADLDPA